jgi:hypothetical protein
MGEAHSRSYRNIPVYFPETGIRPRLVMVADTAPQRRQLAADNFGYETTTDDWREVIERSDIDVVDITAPNAMHEQLATAASVSGKHVFCEKPVGIEPRATAAIEAAARSAKVITAAATTIDGRRWSATRSSCSRTVASETSPTTGAASFRCTDAIARVFSRGASYRRRRDTAP